MKNEIWSYECPLWVDYYTANTLFGLLPWEILKSIIDLVMKNIIKKRQIFYNLRSVKEGMVNTLRRNRETFHFDYDDYDDDDINLCDIYVAKSILINLSKTMNKPLIFSHICCTGKGLSFKYVDDNACKPCIIFE